MIQNSRIIATSFHGMKQYSKLPLSRTSQANLLSKRTIFVGDVDVKGAQIKAGGAIFKIKSLVDLPTEMHTPLTELNELNLKQKKVFAYRMEAESSMYQRFMLRVTSQGKDNFLKEVDSAIRYIWSACNDPDHRRLTTLLTESTSLPEPLSYLRQGHKMMHDNQQTLIGQDKEIISMTHDTVGMYFGSETEEEDARQYVKMALEGKQFVVFCVNSKVKVRTSTGEVEERVISTKWGTPVNIHQWKLVEIEPFPVPFVLKKD